MGLKEYNQQNITSNIKWHTHFLKKNPELHKLFIESMIEMSENNISDKVATMYLLETEPLLKGKSINTVRKYFKDIRDGII
jgi:hypothetical protein|tara:strand:+ start:45 stop:287 length:243 start_codon:yes stop_codon:yes gene_type:complete